MRRHVPWHVRSALVTVFRDLCVARSGAGSRNTFTWSRLGRAVGARPDGPKRASRNPTARYPITTRSLLPGGHRAGSLRGARTPVVCARGGHARDRGAVATSSARGGFWASTRATGGLCVRYTRARKPQPGSCAIGHSAGTTSVITSVICY